MPDFQPVIEAGNTLRKKLQSIGNRSQDDLPLDERVTHFDVDQWYKGCIAVIEEAFGKESREIQDFLNSLKEIDRIHRLRTRTDYMLMEAERIRGAVGILEQFQARLLGRGVPVPISRNRNSEPRHNPWISGSFYLASLAVILVILLVAARTVNPVILPVVIVGSLLLVSTIGAFQLRNDEKLREKNFLTLMGLTFKIIPSLLRVRRRMSKAKGSTSC